MTSETIYCLGLLFLSAIFVYFAVWLIHDERKFYKKLRDEIDNKIDKLKP